MEARAGGRERESSWGQATGGGLFRYKLHGYEEDPWAGLTWPRDAFLGLTACDFGGPECEFLAAVGRPKNTHRGPQKKDITLKWPGRKSRRRAALSRSQKRG